MEGGDVSQRQPDELVAKSVGARALVFAAGAIMNVVSAFLFFILAFTIGVPFEAPEIGGVDPGSPAWEAGFLPGDRVLSIDGSQVIDRTGLQVAVALCDPKTPLSIDIERKGPDGTTEAKTLKVTPEWQPELGFHTMGVLPALDSAVDEPPSDSLAARAGLKKDDRLRGFVFGGRRIENYPTNTLIGVLQRLRLVYPNAELQILIERGGNEVVLDVPRAGPDDLVDTPTIGVAIAGGNVVERVRPGSDAERANQLKSGDMVVAINGAPTHSVEWAELIAADDSVTLELRDASGSRTATIARDVLLRWTLSEQLQWASHTARVGQLTAHRSLETSVATGDLVTAVGDQACYSAEDAKKLLNDGIGATVAITVRRGSEIRNVSLSRPHAIGLTSVLQEGLPPLAWVPDGPAAKAGLKKGDTLVRVGDTPIRSWSDITKSVQDRKVGDAVAVVWRSAGATEESTGTITLAKRAPPLYIMPRLKTNVVKGSILEAIELGAHSTVKTSLYVYMTLRSLVKRQVSAKNLSGPVGITHALTRVSERRSFSYLLYFMAMISINLGLFNLLPFPVLDGGHLLFLAIEKIKGSPVDIRYQEWATNVAVMMILMLFLFVTFNDVMRLFGFS